MGPPRRKKWTEAEERTLIDKYGDMVSDGSLSKMKTREKKYKPIALHVNSIHHLSDSIAYPWEWSWKDVSNKVQNMRHQYSLVKQKIKRPDSGDLVVTGGGECFDWVEGLTHWSNFLRYKEVFGDITLPFDGNNNGFDETSNQEMEIAEFGNIGIEPNGVLSLEYDYEEENYNDNNDNGNGNGNENGHHDYEVIERIGNKKKRKVKNFEKKAWGFVANQLGQLREMEARFEQREEERERERNRKELIRVKDEEEHRKQWEERRKQRNQEWEAMEKEREERRRRRDEELVREREWEERVIRRRSEWNRRIDDMLSQHRVEMAQIHGRILEEQQNVTSQLLGIVSQWSGSDNGSAASNHYLSQMMQNLQHVGGMVDGDDARVEGHNQDDQFIVDG